MLSLAIDQIQAIVFSPTLMGPLPDSELGSRLGLVDGSLIRVHGMEPTATQIALPAHAGMILSSHDAPADFAKAVVYLDHAAAPAVRLNRLTPASYRHLPQTSLDWELGVDHDLYGRPFHSADGVLFDGLATHSDSQVAFRWDGSPARLLAEVIFAPPNNSANPQLGSVDCQIILAREGQLETVHRFSIARNTPDGKALAALVDVDISRAKLVVLVTEQADFGQYGDHIQWLDARIAPARGE